CDADLGDARCGVNLADPAFRGAGTVVAASDRRRFSASGLGDFAAGWFERGRLAWTSGANAGRAIEVRAHRVSGGVALIELWQPMYFAIAGGDEFTVTAGCDKRFETCKAKFANPANFRGFPHMPGNDFALSYARAGDLNDGGPVVE
ncbi:MAG: phage BR0599 family protein, partial [Bauldia sp.]|nr:phage BR0599 family protein [Bauldia sp.]